MELLDFALARCLCDARPLRSESKPGDRGGGSLVDLGLSASSARKSPIGRCKKMLAEFGDAPMTIIIP